MDLYSANKNEKLRQTKDFFYVAAALASAAASTPADDPSSASTVNLAMSLASSSMYAAAPDL